LLAAVTWDTNPENPHWPAVLPRLRERADRIDSEDVLCSVVVLLFAHPSEPAVSREALKKDYFDARTGQSWDLFFPGYYRWGGDSYDEHGVDLSGAPDGPRFSDRDFNILRSHVEDLSTGLWQYSGDVDLVLTNVYLARGEEPFIDWRSTAARTLTRPDGRYDTMSLGGVIEAISRGIENGYESDTWNLPSMEVLRREPSVAGDLATQILAGVASAAIVAAL